MPSIVWCSSCIESPGMYLRRTARYCMSLSRPMAIMVCALCNCILSTSGLCNIFASVRRGYRTIDWLNLHFPRNHQQFPDLVRAAVVVLPCEPTIWLWSFVYYLHGCVPLGCRLNWPANERHCSIHLAQGLLRLVTDFDPDD